MVTQTIDSQTAKDSVKSAEALIARYSEIEPTADLIRAWECLRNAQRHLDQLHWSAAETNAQRATMSVNEAVASVLRSRIGPVVKYLRDEISSLLSDTAEPLSELSNFQRSILDTDKFFDEWSAEEVLERSETLISALSRRVHRIEGFKRALQTLARFDRQSREIRQEIESISSGFPVADPTQLDALFVDLQDLGTRIHGYSLDMIQAGDAKDEVYELNRLARRVSNFGQSLADSPRSTKHLRRGKSREKS